MIMMMTTTILKPTIILATKTVMAMTLTAKTATSMFLETTMLLMMLKTKVTTMVNLMKINSSHQTQVYQWPESYLLFRICYLPDYWVAVQALSICILIPGLASFFVWGVYMFNNTAHGNTKLVLVYVAVVFLTGQFLPYLSTAGQSFIATI